MTIARTAMTAVNEAWLDAARPQQTTLSSAERAVYRVALRHIPGVSADPMGIDVTGLEVIESLAAVSDILGDALGDALREKSRIEDELRALRSDVDAARRIFGGTLTPKP